MAGELKVTAGKWQTWGSNQSGWSTAHLSPIHWRVFLLQVARSIGVRGTGQNRERVSEATPVVGAVQATTPPLTRALFTLVDAHGFLAGHAVDGWPFPFHRQVKLRGVKRFAQTHIAKGTFGQHNQMKMIKGDGSVG